MYSLVSVFLLKGIGGFVFIALNLHLAKVLSLQDYGVISLAFSLITMMIWTSKFGQGVILTRDTKRYSKHGDILFANSYKFTFLNSLLITFLCYLIFILFNFYGLDPYQIRAFSVMIASIIPQSILILYCDRFRGEMNPLKSIAFQNVSIYLPLIIVILVFNITDLIAVAVLYLINVCIVVIILNITADNPKKIFKISTVSRYKKNISNGKSFYLTSAISSINIFISSSVLAAYSEMESVGSVSAILKYASILSFVLIAVNTVYSPKIAKAFYDGDLPYIKNLYSKTTIYFILISMGFIFISYLCRMVVLSYFSIPDSAFTTFMILILAISVNVSFGPTGMVLTMTGHEKSLRKYVFYSCIVNLVLSALLIPKFGMIGFALSYLVNVCMVNVLSFKKVAGIL